MTAGAGEPGSTMSCRACAAEIPEGALRCEKCGAAQGEQRCPHCRATAGASPHPELRYVCDVCGGPRVPPPSLDAPSTGTEVEPLARAKTAWRARGIFRGLAVASGILLGFTVGMLGLAALLWGVGAKLVIAALLTAGPLAAATFWALARAKARGREIAPALDQAWIAVATAVAHASKEPLTSRTLATQLGVGEPQAEELLALLDANDVVRGKLVDGDFAYRPTQVGVRVGARVAEPVAPVAATPEGIDEAAHEDAEAESEAAEANAGVAVRRVER